MLADQIARQIAKSGAFGISKRLFSTHPLPVPIMPPTLASAASHPLIDAALAGAAGGSMAGCAPAAQRPRRASGHEQLSPRGLGSTAASRPAGVAETLMLAIERLREALDAENAEIASGRVVDFQAFTCAKARACWSFPPDAAAGGNAVGAACARR